MIHLATKQAISSNLAYGTGVEFHKVGKWRCSDMVVFPLSLNECKLSGTSVKSSALHTQVVYWPQLVMSSNWKKPSSEYGS